MKSSKKTFLFVIALLAAGASVGGWWWLRAAESPPNSPSTAKVVRRDFASTVLSTGAVRPQVGAEVKVGARIGGRVEKLHVGVGDRVRRGDVLAQLETDELTAQVAVCTADLGAAQAHLMSVVAERPAEITRAEATVAAAEAVLRLAKLNWQRVRGAHRRGVATAHELDTAQQGLDMAKARLAQVKAELA